MNIIDAFKIIVKHIRLCFKEIICSSNYEGFSDCTDRIYGVQYLQQV